MEADGVTTRTEFLEGLQAGGREALDHLVPLVYAELRAIAHRHLAVPGRAATLATTALVHEAYLKLVDQSGAQWRDRAHFFALASVAMRHILIDRARARAAAKRGGAARQHVTLEDDAAAIDAEAESLLEIDDALDKLSEASPRLARVVEYRFYGGLSDDEIAEVLGVTVRTVERDWAKARLFLRRMLAS
jgi:RNA polymerase sigma factor (TIGR02999 family)